MEGKSFLMGRKSSRIGDRISKKEEVHRKDQFVIYLRCFLNKKKEGKEVKKHKLFNSSKGTWSLIFHLLNAKKTNIIKFVCVIV